MQTIPPDVDLEYMAEGGANIIYRIFGDFRGKVLRLRKDVATTTGVQSAQSQYEEFIRPLFSHEWLLEQELVLLCPDLIHRLNSSLLDQERPTKRRGILLKYETHGTLVTDMSAIQGSKCMEIKPKWLTQSPNAPPEAVNCRTCALRAMRQLSPDFCPLILLSVHSCRAASVMASKFGLSELDQVRLRQFLQQSCLFERLKDLQSELDRDGVLSEDPADKRFLTAMTLRDCSVFMQVGFSVLMHPDMKIPDDPKQSFQARLGDLDLKCPQNGKLSYWRDTERRLIDEGWYCKPIETCVLASRGRLS